MTDHLRIVPSVAPWQLWVEGDPTDEQLESLTEDEYEDFAERQTRILERCRAAHPAYTNP